MEAPLVAFWDFSHSDGKGYPDFRENFVLRDKTGAIKRIYGNGVFGARIWKLTGKVRIFSCIGRKLALLI